MPNPRIEDQLIRNLCETKYSQLFEEKLRQLPGRNLKQKERDAQKYAIAESAKQILRQYPLRLPEIWRAIEQAHIARKAGIKITQQQITLAIAAENSWKKSSGHALEQIIVDLFNPKLVQEGINLYLQKDLTEIIHGNRLRNPKQEVPWIKERIQASNFDIYLGFDDATRRGVNIFGLLQSKASIRDRVKGDREFSIDGMRHFFWSVAVCLDGNFLLLPKFTQMVNGGGSSFAEPGWHGMYVFSQQETSGRIFCLDSAFQPFIQHAKKAKNAWVRQRQWLNVDWQPK
jgi:hypothetical protein